LNNAETRTTVEVTSGKNVTSPQEGPRVPPARPSPETRVSRHKPSGTKLLEMIEQKLDEEGIDLAQEPYSNQVVFCESLIDCHYLVSTRTKNILHFVITYMDYRSYIHRL
jgi:hypothetical protein